VRDRVPQIEVAVSGEREAQKTVLVFRVLEALGAEPTRTALRSFATGAPYCMSMYSPRGLDTVDTAVAAADAGTCLLRCRTSA
jgi:23S rRNA (uracil1939-C5)-methyltransferase